MLALAALLVIVCPAPASAAAPSVDGLWDGPGGRVELKTAKGAVEGRLTAASKDVALAPGAVVFQGTVVEDTLSGQVQLGFVAPGCGPKAGTAFSMLLATKTGKLTGSVVAKAPCAKAVRSTLWTRVPEQTAAARAVALEEPPMPPDFMLYDAPAPTAADAERAAMEEGMALSQAGQHEQARRVFLTVTQRQPGRGEAYNGVGVTYALRNDWEAAIEWYKKGLEAQPGFGDLYFNLACAYAQTSRPALSLRYLKLAAVKGFAQPEVLEDPDLEPVAKAPEFAEIRRLMGSVPARR
jgi:hypothetical protein